MIPGWMLLDVPRDAGLGLVVAGLLTLIAAGTFTAAWVTRPPTRGRHRLRC